MNWLAWLPKYWPQWVAGLTLLSALLAAAHAILHKRDSRAATLWLGFIWLLPLLGPILYLALGVNRIRRRALALGIQRTAPHPDSREDLGEPEQAGAEHLRSLARTVNRITSRPLSTGNRVEVLVNGDEAFPPMLAAIDSAQFSVTLSTYIFDNDAAGRLFASALGRAVARGVEVRVLIDAAGLHYTFPSITRQLQREGVTTARFLPLLTARRLLALNLRNHRKLLVVDGLLAFTGGMNLRHGNVLADAPRHPVRDLHFRVAGPVVAQLQQAFAQDWSFSTGESLAGTRWFPVLPPAGNLTARVITDGPDADFEKLRWTLLAALAEAQTSVSIVTPYFVPDPALLTALNLAALRGVQVEILLPEKSNLSLVHWASRALWWQVLDHGCRIWLTPPPFDHSKLLIVDGHWVLLGSANWDTRSLRLNFELNVECYGRDLARSLGGIVSEKKRGAREVTLAEADGRPMPVRLRDGIARLFSPFL